MMLERDIDAKAMEGKIQKKMVSVCEGVRKRGKGWKAKLRHLLLTHVQRYISAVGIGRD